MCVLCRSVWTFLQPARFGPPVFLTAILVAMAFSEWGCATDPHPRVLTEPPPEREAAYLYVTPELVLGVARVGAPVADPTGERIAYTVTERDPSTGRTQTQILLLDLLSGRTRQLTRGASAHSPSWSHDGNALYFLREGQVWILSMLGGEPEQVTLVQGGLTGYQLNPNLDVPPRLRMAISCRVHPDCPESDWDCSDEARMRWEERPGLVSELLPLRHWSSWRDSLRSHVFVGDPESNAWIDITPGWSDCPPFALAGGNPYLFSPDGRVMALIRNLDPDVALSTNNDVFLVDLREILVNRGEAVAEDDWGAPLDLHQLPEAGTTWRGARLVSSGLSGGGGNDDQPCFSPDGRWIAFTSMMRAGYESDLRQIVLHDLETHEGHCLTCGLDRSAYGLVWSHDSRFLYFSAYDRETSAIYRVDVGSGEAARLLRAGAAWGIEPLPDGRLLLLLGSSRMPGEIFICDPESLAAHPQSWEQDLALSADGRFGTPAAEGDTLRGKPQGEGKAALRQLTFHNWDMLNHLEMNQPEHFWFAGAGGDSVHGFILRPASRPGKLPLVMVFHGGPQWAYHDFWLRSYNFQMIAAQGYAVATVNFHGSSGFGIAFQDDIRGRWADLPVEDVMRGLEYIVRRYDFVDSSRVAAIGRSYGGYLVNCLNGQSDRFSCLVTHSGGFNEVTAWGTTEELWFPEWEFYGPPWEYLGTYWANSPFARARHMRTPTLVIHGQRDYRVDLSNGLQTYAALKRQGVEARFLTFPDQGHHIHGPREWLLMWEEIFAWLERYL